MNQYRIMETENITEYRTHSMPNDICVSLFYMAVEGYRPIPNLMNKHPVLKPWLVMRDSGFAQPIIWWFKLCWAQTSRSQWMTYRVTKHDTQGRETTHSTLPVCESNCSRFIIRHRWLRGRFRESSCYSLLETNFQSRYKTSSCKRYRWLHRTILSFPQLYW